MATFESMDRRMPKIEACLKANGLESLDACNEMLLAKGIDCDKIVRGVQPICFDNAVWAYTLGTAIAVKRGLTDAAECAAAIGEGLEAFIISRINGFTYVQTEYDIPTQTLTVVKEIPFSEGERAAVKCYGANDVMEGVAIMKKEDVQCSITGNSTNPVRFQHLVAGTYKKWAIENGKKYFSVASGGGTGRTLHPDNVAAGPASYGLTDSLGRVHGDAQFAGSSSVPAHVEMMGLIGMGNNPMVGATVACAVAAAQANA